MEITKKQVLEAIDLIDKYKSQQLIKFNAMDKRPIEKLELKEREYNALKAADINTIGDLLGLGRGDLRRFRNIGKKSIYGINEAMKKIGLEREGFLYKSYS